MSNSMIIKTELGNCQPLTFISAEMDHSIFSSHIEDLCEMEARDFIDTMVTLDEEDNLIFANDELKEKILTVYNRVSYKNNVQELISNEELKEAIESELNRIYEQNLYDEKVTHFAKELLQECLNYFNEKNYLTYGRLEAEIMNFDTYYVYNHDTFNVHLSSNSLREVYNNLNRYISDKFTKEPEKINNYFKDIKVDVQGDDKTIVIHNDFFVTDTTFPHILNYWFINELPNDYLSDDGTNQVLYYKVTDDIGCGIYEYINVENENYKDLLELLNLLEQNQ